MESPHDDKEVGGGQDDIGEDQGQKLINLRCSSLVGLSSSRVYCIEHLVLVEEVEVEDAVDHAASLYDEEEEHDEEDPHQLWAKRHRFVVASSGLIEMCDVLVQLNVSLIIHLLKQPFTESQKLVKFI